MKQIIPLCLNFYISTNRLSLWSVAVILLPLNVISTVFVLLTHCRRNVTLSLVGQGQPRFIIYISCVKCKT